MTAIIKVPDDTEALLELFNTADSGPSPFGGSHHEAWITCGRKAQLREQERLSAESEDGEVEFVTDPTVINNIKVGVYAHKLWEGRVKRMFGEDLVWDARATTFNASFRKALDVYRDYHRIWGSVEERWGCRVLGTEVSLGGPVVAGEVLRRLGGPYTGRADLVIEIVDTEACRRNTGLVLLPGVYLYDLKSGKSHGANDKEMYEDGLQSKSYLWLHTLEHGEQGALGFVVDRAVWGHKEITREKSYAAYVAYPDLFAEEKMRAVVTLSNRSKVNPLPNPLACRDRYGRLCWFKTSGKCSGF